MDKNDLYKNSPSIYNYRNLSFDSFIDQLKSYFQNGRNVDPCKILGSEDAKVRFLLAYLPIEAHQFLKATCSPIQFATCNFEEMVRTLSTLYPVKKAPGQVSQGCQTESFRDPLVKFSSFVVTDTKPLPMKPERMAKMVQEVTGRPHPVQKLDLDAPKVKDVPRRSCHSCGSVTHRREDCSN